jgi:spermidine synthase
LRTLCREDPKKTKKYARPSNMEFIFARALHIVVVQHLITTNGQTLQRLFPYVLVTTSGAAIMVLELVGSRLLSPYFGGTTVIWTALIGIIMASLALGYWWGGRLADTRRDYRTLAAIFAVSAVWIVGIALTKETVLSQIAGQFSDIRVAACVAATVLFGMPSFLLAAVGPYVIRMQIDDIASSGATIGRLNAASTGGSIAGTFLAGFVLLALVGHFKVLIGLAGVLIATGASCFIEAKRAATLTAVFALLLGGAAAQYLEAPMPVGTQLDVDSHYERIQVADGQEPGTGRPTRVAFTDIYGAQAGIYLDALPGAETLLFDFQRFFRVVHHFRPDARSMLTIGGGVGSVAQDFLRRRPDGRVDVVEIDPAFIELGRKHFKLVDDPRMRIFHEDGRTFVRNSRDQYDTVVVDAFGSAGSVPYQLTTDEFVAALHARLDARGVVAVNLASAIEGERGLLAQAMVATYKKHFEQVTLFQLDPGVDPAMAQSLMLVALRGSRAPSFASADPELRHYLARRWKGAVPEQDVLTDDFAPVDYFFNKAVF